MLSLELGIIVRVGENGEETKKSEEKHQVSVRMGSGCVCAAGAGSVRERSRAVREAQQEGLQRNLSAANGRTQLQSA